MKKLASALLVALIALAIAPWLVWWSRLPDPMASHWSLGSEPNGHTPRLVLFVLLVVLTTPFAISTLVALHQDAAASRPASAAPGLSFAAGVLTTITFSVVYVQRDVAVWQETRLPLVWLLAAFAIGGVTAVVTRAGTPAPLVRVEELSLPPALRVGRSEAVAWVGHAHARWMLVLAIGFIAAGGIMIPTTSVFGGVVTIVAGLPLAWLTSTQVVVGRSGVRVRGALAWPSFSIPLDRIESAESTAVHPTEWGGWGYRGSLRFSKSAAFVVRRGEGLKLKLRNKKKGVNVTFTVTVDDADAAAGVVNGLISSSARSR